MHNVQEDHCNGRSSTIVGLRDSLFELSTIQRGHRAGRYAGCRWVAPPRGMAVALVEIFGVDVSGADDLVRTVYDGFEAQRRELLPGALDTKEVPKSVHAAKQASTGVIDFYRDKSLAVISENLRLVSDANAGLSVSERFEKWRKILPVDGDSQFSTRALLRLPRDAAEMKKGPKSLFQPVVEFRGTP